MTAIQDVKALFRDHFPRVTQLYRSTYCFVRDFRFRFLSPEGVFNHIYKNNEQVWNSSESASGPGSALAETAPIRAALPKLLAELGVRSMLDLPCGDLNWMRNVELDGVRYVGADIVEALIVKNRERFADRTFLKLDVIREPLGEYDLILCKDLLIHFSFENAQRALENVKRSGSKYLLTTTYRQMPENQDIMTGQFKPINLERAPYNLPAPRLTIPDYVDHPVSRELDKVLALWKIDDLR